MLRVANLHTDLIGKVAKLHPLAVELEENYFSLFGIGNPYAVSQVHHFCYCGGKYEMSLLFIDEPPISKGKMVWYCLKEIGNGVMGDWHWLTLDQLIICE